MIRTNRNITEIKGDEITIVAELGATACCIKKILMQNGDSEERAKEKIMNAVEFGLKSDEEMDAFVEEKLKEVSDKLAKALFDQIFRP